jgi:trehalose-phosphatase
VFLDYDGTLAPIVADPGEARLPTEMHEVVSALAKRFPVAVISGRDREDVAERVGIDGLYYAGSHGLDIAGPGASHTPPGADAAARRLRAAAGEIRQLVEDIDGVLIERKRFSVAVHYRQVEAARVERVREAVAHAATEWGLEVRRGRQVQELVPDMAWNKGRALQWLREVLAIDPAHTCMIYIGDDETDEDAFRALGPDGIGFRPGPRVAASLADYHLADVNAVCRFLQWLMTAPED